MIPPEHGHRAHDLIPDSRLRVLAGAGHFPHCDRPERFTDLLQVFLDETAPARRSSTEHADRVAAHATLDSATP
jgi:hypothetical protein